MASSIAVTNLRERLDERFGNGTGVLFVLLLLATVILFTVPLEIPELTLSLVGAIVYSVLQVGQQRRGTKKQKKGSNAKDGSSDSQAGANSMRSVRSGGSWRSPPTAARSERPQLGGHPQSAAAKKDFRQPSVAPIVAPTFSCVGWDSEVQELVQEISPTAEGAQAVQALVERARNAVQRIVPEAEVTGFGCGRIKRGKAFGVAVPDVDIVVSVDPAALVQSLERHLRNSHVARLDARKLQKSAIRACTDQLVSVGGFKFRRSAFKGHEPKVTLLGPIIPGVCDEAIPVDLSVNSATPLHNAVLLTECGQMQPRARDLILLVQRWARDRGISHAAKGNLPPYAWSLLAIYFAQVGVADEASLLPPLEGFGKASALAGLKNGSVAAETTREYTKKSIGELFGEFINFFDRSFDWRNEAVSVRLGKRGGPDLSLPIHVVVDDKGSTSVAVSIEDPFNVSRNVGTFLTGSGCQRLREEFARAAQICSRDGSLGELLEPWAPPEWNASPDHAGGDQVEE